MSTKPNPVAHTAAMLTARWLQAPQKNPVPPHALRDRTPLDVSSFADLASALHRLAPACKRHAIALCNGEWHEGQRARCVHPDQVAEIDASIEAYGSRLDKRLAKLNEGLAPFALKAGRHGDPRGIVLIVRNLDPSRPLPRNGWLGSDGNAWGVA